METDSDVGSVVVFDTSGSQVTGSGLRLEDGASSAAPLEPESLDHPDFFASPTVHGRTFHLRGLHPRIGRLAQVLHQESTLWDFEKAILRQILSAILEDVPEAYGLA
ncbi:hypothetical protein LTR29_017980 [Friedmanniomyces endolithicus]|nr:hypothetical protein LTR29_017980 [Friedmanniomyces endolithicus]